MTEVVDILILGSGFGGSLLAAIARQLGRSVVLVDRASHPRFAVGESSTPLADQTLAELARTYDLPELLPLTNYDAWRRLLPQLGCGAKQGFSYFGHQPHTDFDPAAQLLVAARETALAADTHWLRSDVDQFIFQRAQTCGAQTHENAVYQLQQTDRGWKCTGTAADGDFAVEGAFVVDATGRAGEVLRTLDIADTTHELATHSHAVFAHFQDVDSVACVMDDLQVDRTRHPFPCDDAAVHHVLSEGWMWQLRFCDDTLSAGLTSQRKITDASVWRQTIDDHPFLQRQFRRARIIRPGNALVGTGRIQFLKAQAAGPTWAALPSSVGFIDPLHSTGIAHTLFAVRRIASHWQSPDAHWWDRYSQTLRQELRHIDQLVAGCYHALPSFRLWSDWCMLYFAVVTSAEARAEESPGFAADDALGPSFLQADDGQLATVIVQARRWLEDCRNAGSTDAACELFETRLRDAIGPWNHVGLLPVERPQFYKSTACPFVDPFTAKTSD